MPDQQMRSEPPRYPVDRYLVESSKKGEIVNIMNDDIWNSEPALRPEDEIILRKLHEMLQSTADDLKMLSGELSKYREPGAQVKTAPTPLDDEFNEKVHIEEIVNAKFHGYQMMDKATPLVPNFKTKNEINERVKSLSNNLNKNKVNAGVQVNPMPILKKPMNRKLSISRTKVMQINDASQEHLKEKNMNNANKVFKNGLAANCSEFSYKYNEVKDNRTPKKLLNVQNMPSINIRSELTERRVLHLDILPDDQKNKQISYNDSNVAVVAIKHEPLITEKKCNTNSGPQFYPQLDTVHNKIPIRKISVISPGESSGSTNNISSDAQHKLKSRRQIAQKLSPKHSSRIDNKRNQKFTGNKKPVEKKSHFNLDEWKNKLNAVYGQPSTSRKSKLSVKSNPNIRTATPKKNKQFHSSNSILNNASYIPYSQLTLGGVRVSDIEKEISDIPNKNELPLSPILERILYSRENSFNKGSPRKDKENDNPKILTTSDENLLQEVIDIERTVAKTMSKNTKEVSKPEIKSPNISSENSVNGDAESYADDFEDEKSDIAEESVKKGPSSESNSNSDSDESGNGVNVEKYENNHDDDNDDKIKKNDLNSTYTKISNLSFKNKVDIHEFVHSIDTQDIATQSTNAQKKSLKETQTSPRNEISNIQPIHNDLWSSVDPKGEVEKMLKLEKDFIKKLILEEYGDLLEKNIAKPSTSKHQELEDTQTNTASFPKNTQTSPAHVKCVMTSPTRTKTRTTSPLILTLPVDRQTSPMICVTSEEELKLEIENVGEDLGITINLSSPRFSLRLPQNSREILSNFDGRQTPTEEKQKEDNYVKESKVFRKCTTSSSSSADADNSSSEISSLGEVKLKLKRRLRKNRISSISDSSFSSILSKCSSDLQSVGILPLRSEGEVSLGQAIRKKYNKRSESDGEMKIVQFD